MKDSEFDKIEDLQEPGQMKAAFKVITNVALSKSKTFFSKIAKPVIIVLAALVLGFMIYTQVGLVKDIRALQADSSIGIEKPIVEDVQLYDSVYNSDLSEGFVQNDSIDIEDYMNARKIEKIKYYISITRNRPSNKQFFFNWITRTVEDEK